MQMEIVVNTDELGIGTVPKAFQCTICPKSFTRKLSLEEHILNKHVDKKEFQCTVCLETKQLGKFFATQQILNQHIRQAHGPPRFKCPVCFKTFNNSSSFAVHKGTHSQTYVNRHPCDLCSKPFHFKYQLQAHLFNIHKQKCEDVSYFKCEICSREFVKKFNLERHVINHHVVDKPFECLVCSKTFIDQQSLEQHVKTHDRGIEHFCDVCSKGFTLKSSLAKHLGVIHKHFFYCDKCSKSFKNKPDFDSHILESKQELKCYICQELMESECNFKIHTDSHVKEIKAETKDIRIETPVKLLQVLKPNSTEELNQDKFQCELCSKTFEREKYFKAHRVLEHQNAEWKCNFEGCSRTFGVYRKFRLHKLTHAETKEFVCNICGKSFYSHNYLKKHGKMHLPEKKYKCDICPGKSFTLLSSLMSHTANNHGGPKPFKCPVLNCGTSWANNSQLNNHLVSHQTDKSVKCEMCLPFKAFKTLKHLKNHHCKVHSGAKKNQTLRSRKNIKYKKLSDTVIFICSSNACSFETDDEKNVALHYNEQHQLPKVIIFDNSSTLSASAFMSLSKFESNRMIQKRYKCRICPKYFQFSSSISKHQKRFHSAEATSFMCSHCSKPFKYDRNLNRHIRETHSEFKLNNLPVNN